MTGMVFCSSLKKRSFTSKTATFIVALMISSPVWATTNIVHSSTNDVPAIHATIPAATTIRATASGFSVTTPTGTRQVYKTPNGYYIEGGKGSANQQLIRTSTGYRIEDSQARGRVFGNHGR
jgi:hypothetical protein